MNWTISPPKKISLCPETRGPPIQKDDLISWHVASFKDIMSQELKMTACSYNKIGLKLGWAGDGRKDWFSWIVQYTTCYLGEKSVWEGWDGTIYLVEVVSLNGEKSRSYPDCEKSYKNIHSFEDKVIAEAIALDRTEEQFDLAWVEIYWHGCIVFIDRWLDGSTELLDIDTYNGSAAYLRRDDTIDKGLRALCSLGTVVRQLKTQTEQRKAG